MTAPTDIPEEYAPVGEVLDVVPGALVRRPPFALSPYETAVQRLASIAHDFATVTDLPTAAPSLVRLDAMEDVVEAAVALVATMARWQDQALTDEEIALRSMVRAYQEVSA